MSTIALALLLTLGKWRPPAERLQPAFRPHGSATLLLRLPASCGLLVGGQWAWPGHLFTAPLTRRSRELLDTFPATAGEAPSSFSCPGSRFPTQVHWKKIKKKQNVLHKLKIYH